MLSTRLSSASKKLSLETKIRDGAISLSKLHPSKPSSIANGTSNEKVSAANRKVDTARAELIRISERLTEVQQRLWEHRSGVLSYTVTKLEKELRPFPQGTGDVSGRCTPANGRNKSGEHSPTSSFSCTSRIHPKFEGPHLFAGHEGAALLPLSKQPAVAAALEEKLKSFEESLAESSKAGEELRADLKRVRLQKSEVENSLGAQLQTAEEEIAKLQDEVERMRQMREQLDEIVEENRGLVTQKRELEAEVEEKSSRLQEMEERMEALQREQGRAEGMENILAQVKQSAKVELDRKDEELRAIKDQITREREDWTKERQALEDEKLEDLSQLQQELESSQARDTLAARIAEEELETASKALQALVRTHRILTMGGEGDVASLVVAVGAHMEALVEENGKKAKVQDDWDKLRRKLEDDLRASLERRDKLGQEVETAREEREEARKEVRFLEESLRVGIFLWRLVAYTDDFPRNTRMALTAHDPLTSPQSRGCAVPPKAQQLCQRATTRVKTR
jgi:DNA repair exonuclease SbcCD ATPase subunit